MNKKKKITATIILCLMTILGSSIVVLAGSTGTEYVTKNPLQEMPVQKFRAEQWDRQCIQQNARKDFSGQSHSSGGMANGKVPVPLL